MSGVVAMVAPTPARPCCRAISERIHVHSRIRASSSGGIGLFSTASAYDCELLWAHPRSGSISANAGMALFEINMLAPKVRWSADQACAKSILRSRPKTIPATSHAARRILTFSRFATLHPMNQPGATSLADFAKSGRLG